MCNKLETLSNEISNIKLLFSKILNVKMTLRCVLSEIYDFIFLMSHRYIFSPACLGIGTFQPIVRHHLGEEKALDASLSKNTDIYVQT